MSLLEAILLGLVQGLTEFLPVSSSGHDVLAAKVLGHDLPSLQKQAWVVLVHLASALAIAIFFLVEFVRVRRRRGEAVEAGAASSASEMMPVIRWGWFLGAATIPAGIAYLVFRDFFDEVAYQHVEMVAGLLLVNALVLFTVDRLKPSGEGRVHLIDPRSKMGLMIILIGVAQAFAMLPGISRSGATIAVALLVGLRREEAVRFSFALGLVAILLATGKTILEGTGLAGLVEVLGVPVLVAGFLASLVASLGALWLLLSMVRRMRLWWFALYCLIVSISTFVWLAMGGEALLNLGGA